MTYTSASSVLAVATQWQRSGNAGPLPRLTATQHARADLHCAFSNHTKHNASQLGSG